MVLLLPSFLPIECKHVSKLKQLWSWVPCEVSTLSMWLDSLSWMLVHLLSWMCEIRWCHYSQLDFEGIQWKQCFRYYSRIYPWWSWCLAWLLLRWNECSKMLCKLPFFHSLLVWKHSHICLQNPWQCLFCMVSWHHVWALLFLSVFFDFMGFCPTHQMLNQSKTDQLDPKSWILPIL